MQQFSDTELSFSHKTVLCPPTKPHNPIQKCYCFQGDQITKAQRNKALYGFGKNIQHFPKFILPQYSINHDKYHILAKIALLVLPKNSGNMSVIYLLLALSILVALIFFIAFIVSVRKGQYDDSYTPSVRMLFEDELVSDPEKNPKKETNQISESQIL